MTQRAGERQFLEDVFPAEVAEIRRRRENADDDRALPEPSEALRPSARHGLVGLAFSGGGIRSAAFSLGVLQVLIPHRLFKYFDYLFVSVNRISMHPFYRDRLSRTFLIRPDGDEVVSADDTKMSELAGVHSRAPYHLINTALNLQGSTEPTLRERKTVPMVLAPRFCGSDHTGYCSTATLETRDPHFNLGTAMAISAAAAAPNMGALRFRGLTFIMALLNIRLNYWLPHPANVQRRPWRFLDLSGQVGLGYLLAEALGRADDRSEFVNCSDGGHIENLGVYELLKRRCRVIVCVDGEQDPDHRFHSLVTLQRYAEIDFGIRIDLGGISPAKNALAKAHHATGKIIYPDDEEGLFIYLKLAYTGDEPEYLRYYRRLSPKFPHESTGNQFFGETQFEVYRALGIHTARGVLEDLRAIATDHRDSTTGG